jgi:hypothetical protein
VSGKYALVIGNTDYIDPGLAQLSAPGKDAEDFARILKDPNLCGFDDVKVLLNQISSTVIEAVDEFFDQKKPDDLLILFFSGHGVRDELGSLFLAVKNTIRSRLRSTAIKSDYIREVMDQSRSRRQVLILDCCNSGAFAQGTKAEIGGTMGMVSAFQGYGRYVLTASDATQFAWEGNKVIGETQNSLFTHFLVKGLEGEADNDGDGKITVDELYDYAFEQIVSLTPKQKPNKSATKQEGDIVLRQITRLEDIRPISLPDELAEAIDDTRTFVREGAVQQLAKLLRGKNLGLARSARDALERVERQDDSRRVSQMATQALEPVRQADLLANQKAEKEGLASAPTEAERLLVEQKLEAEHERLAIEKAESERKDLERAEQLARQRVEQEGVAKATLDRERVLERKRIAAQEPKQNATSYKPKNILDVLKSILKQPISLVILALGILVLVFSLWIFLPQLVFLSSNSASESPALSTSFADPRITVKTVDYEATSLALNGIDIELEIDTNSLLQDKPCQVIVYFRRANGSDLTASRSLATILSPYIGGDQTVSVYTNFTPSNLNSTWNIKLFMPYAAIGASGLPDGTYELQFFAELHYKDSNKFITRSSGTPFTYTK